MPRLNNQKPILLNQVKNQPAIELSKLLALIDQYEDLEPADFKGYVSDVLFEQLQEAGRDPRELELWNRIVAAPAQTPEEIQQVQRLVTSYSQQYPAGPKIGEVREMDARLQTAMAEAMRQKRMEEDRAREQNDWLLLERGNYNDLRNYKLKYPNSVHLSELDDLMWANTNTVVSENNFRRYLSDWPAGNYAEQARAALNSIPEWEVVKRSEDLLGTYDYLLKHILRVDDYRDNHPDCLFKNEVDSLYYQLRDQLLVKMKESPSEFDRDQVEQLLTADIFTRWNLEDEGLITPDGWVDRDSYPNIQDYQVENPNISAPEDCTDIYLFGTPGTGKTCLLMGLTGANGSGYTLNMKSQGGDYAAALQQYVAAGITPGRTFGKFVTVINGRVTEKGNRDSHIDHRVNLVEMSGEEFAIRIANNKNASLANMGTGVTNLLRNNNRKVFFIIIDSSKLRVKVEYLEQTKDAEGNVIREGIREAYVSQLDIMNKFVSLFELPENQEIMKNVDAIHFVVTKADTLGDKETRLQKAHDLLLSTYKGPVEQLKAYCRRTKRINYSTNYRPHVFTFSLGKFYLGDVFKFDEEDTLKIIDTIKIVTSGLKETTWWDKFKEKIG